MTTLNTNSTTPSLTTMDYDKRGNSVSSSGNSISNSEGTENSQVSEKVKADLNTLEPKPSSKLQAAVAQQTFKNLRVPLSNGLSPSARNLNFSAMASQPFSSTSSNETSGTDVFEVSTDSDFDRILQAPKPIINIYQPPHNGPAVSQGWPDNSRGYQWAKYKTENDPMTPEDFAQHIKIQRSLMKGGIVAGGGMVGGILGGVAGAGLGGVGSVRVMVKSGV